MKEMTQDEKRRIVEKLESVGAKLPCPRCGNREFTLVDGYFNHPVQAELKGMVIGGKSVPTAATVCNRCGFVSEHAIGVLRLMPEPVAEEGERE